MEFQLHDAIKALLMFHLSTIKADNGRATRFIRSILLVSDEFLLSE